MSGKLIVLEGIDGSGKSTQYELLCRRLELDGVSFRKIVFPRYDKESSALLRMYLAGEFGKNPSDVNAYAASTFYAVDRYASFKTDWGDWYKQGGVVLCDRYTTSNACHQGSKLPEKELAHFLNWLAEFEYGYLELPRPDLVIYLNTELEASLALIRSRQQAAVKGDIHEKDEQYLRRALKTGRYAAAHYHWRVIDSVRDGVLRNAEEIHKEIYATVMEVIGKDGC